MLERLWRFWKRLTKPAQPAVTVAPIGHNCPPAVINREDEGAHFYLRDVLDQIRDTHRLLRKLKRVDRDAYDFQGRVGARVLPKKVLAASWQMPERFPAAGMAYLRDNDGGFFVYFTKVSDPQNVQPWSGDVLRMSAVWTDKQGKVRGSSSHVGIKDGRATALRERILEPVRLGRFERFHRMAWKINPNLQFMHRCWNEKGHSDSFDDFVHELVVETVTAWLIPARDELQVRARRGDTTALLSVCTKRTPYFFKDRETGLAADGKRKRIFHIVQAHDRHLADGSVQQVKEHYRGERRFKWDGTDVTITVPGLHHAHLERFDATAVVVSDDDIDPPDTLSAADVGRRISEAIS